MKNEKCYCASGKKFESCCKTKIQFLKEYNWVKWPNEYVSGLLSKKSDKWERLLLKYPIMDRISWVKDSRLPIGINYRNSYTENGYFIRLRKMPPFPVDFHMIAHEFLHIVIDLEKYPSFAHTKIEYENIASSLSSSLLDPVVEHRLQAEGFTPYYNYIIELKSSINQTSKIAVKELPDPMIHHFAANIFSNMIDLNELKKYHDNNEELMKSYLKKLESLFPEAYSLASNMMESISGISFYEKEGMLECFKIISTKRDFKNYTRLC